MTDNHSSRRPSSVKSTTSIRGLISRLTHNPEKYTVHTEIPAPRRIDPVTRPSRQTPLSKAEINTRVYETLCISK